MIDLENAKRPEFVKAYQSLQSEIKSLTLRLQEYEGIQTDDDLIKEADKFLFTYGSSRNRKQVIALWKKLSKKKKTKIWKTLPLYLKESDAKFRLYPDKWLRHEKYNDDYRAVKEFHRPTTGAKALNPMADKLKELEKIRESRTVNISDRIKSLKSGE